MQNTKEEIFNTSRELFIEKGFKETGISEITKKVGIAVGTFYKFYSSKEELFMDIFIKEDQALKKDIMNSIDFQGDITEILIELIPSLLEGMKENPILKEWYSKENYKAIINKLEKPYLEISGQEDVFYNFFLDIVEKWQIEGKLNENMDREYILALFNSLAFIELHRDEIGEEYFPKLLNDITSFIVKGLKP